MLFLIIQGLVGLAFLGSGGMKAAMPKDKLIENMQTLKGFPESQIKMIGGAEVLGGLALILSLFITSPIALLLGGIAAICLFVLMAGAVYTHLNLGEGIGSAVPAGVLGTLSLVVAYTLLI